MSLVNAGFMTLLLNTLELPASELCMALQAYLWTDLISLAYQAHSSSDPEEVEQGHALLSALASLSLRLNDAAMKQVITHRKAAKDDKVASQGESAAQAETAISLGTAGLSFSSSRIRLPPSLSISMASLLRHH